MHKFMYILEYNLLSLHNVTCVYVLGLAIWHLTVSWYALCTPPWTRQHLPFQFSSVAYSS